MKFSDLLILGGTTWILKKALQKETSDIPNDDIDFEKLMAEIDKPKSRTDTYVRSSEFQLEMAEWDRIERIGRERRRVPCFWNDGIMYDDFVQIAKLSARGFKRLRLVSVDDAVIRCNVESQTGYSDWYFTVDFNNWGHVTGTFWTLSDNEDSLIPKRYGKIVSGLIHELLKERNILLNNLSDVVNDNKDLGTERGLNYFAKEKKFKKSMRVVIMENESKDLIGEHLYPVISLLKKMGFKNIKSVPIEDANLHNRYYIYKVEQVIVAGTEYFNQGDVFYENSEVIITYHEKQRITMPFSERDLIRKNYIDVGDILENLGFTEIYERKINDIAPRMFRKEGIVDRILIDGNENSPIKKGEKYEYDAKIVIVYHSFKK